MTPHFFFLMAILIFLLVFAGCAAPAEDNRMRLEQIGAVRAK